MCFCSRDTLPRQWYTGSLYPLSVSFGTIQLVVIGWLLLARLFQLVRKGTSPACCISADIRLPTKARGIYIRFLIFQVDNSGPALQHDTKSRNSCRSAFSPAQTASQINNKTWRIPGADTVPTPIFAELTVSGIFAVRPEDNLQFWPYQRIPLTRIPVSAQAPPDPLRPACRGFAS